MPRDIQIYGPTMVSVIGGGHMSGYDIGRRNTGATGGDLYFQLGNIFPVADVWRAEPSELGLTSERISILPQFHHLPIKVDGFGSMQSPEVMVNLAGAIIDMTLVHYDPDVLDTCQAESLGGAKDPVRAGEFGFAGVMNPAGALLGNNRRLYASGCHYIGLLLDNAVSASGNTQNKAWWFPSCHLLGPPQEIPIGTERSLIRLRWQAVPYTPYNLSGVNPATDFYQRGTTEAIGSFPNVPFYGGSGLELSSSGSVIWKKIDYGVSGQTYGVLEDGPTGTYKGIYFID